MKRIINWTFGSVFRTFGRIIAYIAIGALFALIMSKNNIKITDLLGIEKVHAATTITPSSYGHKVEWVRETTGGTYVDTQSSNWINGDLTNFCTGGYMCYLKNEWVRITLNTSLDAGRTYTYNFNSWYITRQTQSWYNSESFYMMASNTGQHSGSSSANITNLSCRAGLEEGTTSKVTWSCSFTPTTPINYIYLRITAPSNYYTETFTSYGCNAGSLVYDNSQTDAINNQTNIIVDQTDIINNNITESTNQIINGLEGINEANQVCQLIDKNSVIENGKYINSNGAIYNYNGWGYTDYYSISSTSVITVTSDTFGNTPSTCFYNINKTLLSCIQNSSLTNGYNFIIPSGASFVRFSINIELDKPQFQICKNGNQALNDTLTDDNVSDAQNEAGSFFSNFTTNTHGLTSIITAPLTAIESLTSQSCSPLVLPLPFVDEDLTLPCMRPIYEQNFGGFMTLYDAITMGIVSYWILVRIFALVKDFKNPDHDEIEVVDL